MSEIDPDSPGSTPYIAESNASEDVARIAGNNHSYMERILNGTKPLFPTEELTTMALTAHTADTALNHLDTAYKAILGRHYFIDDRGRIKPDYETLPPSSCMPLEFLKSAFSVAILMQSSRPEDVISIASFIASEANTKNVRAERQWGIDSQVYDLERKILLDGASQAIMAYRGTFEA